MAKGPNKALVPTEEALTKEPRPSTSLRELLEHRQAMLDTWDLLPEEQVDAFLLELSSNQGSIQKKVDDTAGLIRHCERLAEEAEKEKDHFGKRQKRFGKLVDKLRSGIKSLMHETGEDRWEGTRYTFRLQETEGAVEVQNPQQVPAHCKLVTLTMSGEVYQKLVQAQPWIQIPDEGVSIKTEVSKTLVRQALESGELVEGADLITGSALYID